jgi:hypothetical protein
VQMLAGALPQCRGGQGIDSVPVLMWVGGGLGPGADVGGNEPSPVVSERSPKTQMRAHRGEPFQAVLRCAHTALQRMPLPATAGGAMRRAVHRCTHPSKFRLSDRAHPRDALGLL